MMEFPKQLFFGTEKPTVNKFVKIRDVAAGLNKPAGGLWTSSYVINDKCGWEKWVAREEFNEDEYTKKWMLSINENARVLTIDSKEDAEKAYEDFPLLGDCNVPELNYENIAQKYDIVHLTENGYEENNLGPMGKILPAFLFEELSFDSWDCESSLIINWDCINNIKSMEI